MAEMFHPLINMIECYVGQLFVQIELKIVEQFVVLTNIESAIGR